MLHVLGGTPVSFVCLRQAFIHLRYSPALNGVGAADAMHVLLVESFNFCRHVACWGCPLDIIGVHVLQALWCRVSTNSMLQLCVQMQHLSVACRRRLLGVQQQT